MKNRAEVEPTEAAQTPRGPRAASCMDHAILKYAAMVHVWSPRDLAATHCSHSDPCSDLTMDLTARARTGGSRPTWAGPLSAWCRRCPRSPAVAARSPRGAGLLRANAAWSPRGRSHSRSPGGRSPQLHCRAEFRRPPSTAGPSPGPRAAALTPRGVGAAKSKFIY